MSSRGLVALPSYVEVEAGRVAQSKSNSHPNPEGGPFKLRLSGAFLRRAHLRCRKKAGGPAFGEQNHESGCPILRVLCEEPALSGVEGVGGRLIAPWALPFTSRTSEGKSPTNSTRRTLIAHQFFITSSQWAPSQTHHPPCLKMEANMIAQARTVSPSRVVDALQRPFVSQSISPLTPYS